MPHTTAGTNDVEEKNHTRVLPIPISSVCAQNAQEFVSNPQNLPTLLKEYLRFSIAKECTSSVF